MLVRHTDQQTTTHLHHEYFAKFATMHARDQPGVQIFTRYHFPVRRPKHTPCNIPRFIAFLLVLSLLHTDNSNISVTGTILNNIYTAAVIFIRRVTPKTEVNVFDYPHFHNT